MHSKNSTPAGKENLIKKATKIVEDFMTIFKSDFYEHDLKTFNESNNFIWSLRQSGTDISNLEQLWNDEFISNIEMKNIEIELNKSDFMMFHERNTIYFHVLNGKLISKTIDQIKNVFDNAVNSKIVDLH